MENLKAHLDGQLNATDVSAVDTHLETHENLREMRDQFVLITNTLKTTETGKPYGQEKLFERLNAPKATSVQDKKVWRLASLISIASFAIIGLVSFPMFAQSKVAAKKSASSLSASTSAEMPYQVEKPEQADPNAEAASPASGRVKMPIEGLAGDELAGKSRNGSVQEQWYQTQDAGPSASKGAPNGGGSVLSEESEFKSRMRNERDKAANGSIVSQPLDTPKGIYLERSGDVKVKVEDVGRSVNEATGLAASLGGFVVNTNVSNGTDGGIGTITMRVPTKNFVTAMQKIEEMGERLASNSTSNDITTETITESTSMISWADEEARLIKELNASRDRDEKWRIRQQLAQVRVNLEVHRANVKSLKERGEFSTLAVQFLSGDKVDATGNTNWSGNAFRDAKGGLGDVGKIFGTIAIYGLVFSPVWLPFLIAYVVIRKRNS